MPKFIAGLILVLLGVTVGVYATNLFTQSFTAVPATTSVLTANCTALLSSPATIAPGSSGGLFFGCATSGCTLGCSLTGPAITVAADGAALPTFTLPSPYTGVALNNVGSTPPTGGCTFPPTSSPTILTSGQSFSFTGTFGKGNSFYYCVSYAAPAGTTSLPSFDVAWTQ